ncbi:MAG: hypothetical protein Q9227_004497 [Pyrenula ochraceoflavens]
MTRVLLTGGNGFVAGYILESLLQRQHSVVFTVRSLEKGNEVLKCFRVKRLHAHRKNISFVVVRDIFQPGALDSALVSDPPFEAVIHTVSPCHFDAKEKDDVEKMLSVGKLCTETRQRTITLTMVAESGTEGILTAIKDFAHSVTRVIFTSSFDTIVNYTIEDRERRGDRIYTEVDWNPAVRENAFKSPADAYREQAAWDFMKGQTLNFTLTTINPGAVIGKPIDTTSSNPKLSATAKHILDIMSGMHKLHLPTFGDGLWVYVRDVAWAHVSAMELYETKAGNKRFLVASGTCTNRDFVNFLWECFLDLRDKLPEGEAASKYGSVAAFKCDNHASKECLDIKYRSLSFTMRYLVPYLQKLQSSGEGGYRS